MEHSISVLDGTGDTRLTWNEDNTDEVAAARKLFDDLRAKRFIAYTVTGKGEKGEMIERFDPTAEKIILSPPMRGG